MSSFSIFPILLGARPPLSVSSHISDSYGRAPDDENEFVCLIRGGQCLLFLPVTLAYSSQMLLQRVSDSSALREVVSYGIPLQRVSMRLPFLLRLLHLLGFLKGDEGRSNFLLFSSILSLAVSCTLLGSLLDFRVCVSISRQVSPRFESEMSLT